MRNSYRPPRKTRPGRIHVPLLTVTVVVIAFIGLFLFGVTVQNLGEKDAAAATAPPEETEPGIGWAVRDGRFEFTVSRVDCSKSTVGFERLERTAKGTFCVVGLQVRNIGESPQLFLGGAQKAYDAAGAGYGNDELAGLYANKTTQTFLRKIDPGDKVTGKLVFDVPEDVTLTTLELHDSPLSGGVEVTLRD